jgi:hypothetical protein
MQQKIHFISYGNKRYNRAKERIKKEALETGWFNSVKIYEPKDLTVEFNEKYKDVLEMDRGGGYWIWKLDIIKQELSGMNDGDILVYCDAGCVVNKCGEKRFRKYVDILNGSNNGIISFQMNTPEKKWTTKEIFDYFDLKVDSKIGKSGQINATVLVMKKCDYLKQLLDKYGKVLDDDMWLFTDKYNGEKQCGIFRDNRHDQSVFSMIRKIYGSIVLRDETGKNENNIKLSPFVAMRKRK